MANKLRVNPDELRDGANKYGELDTKLANTISKIDEAINILKDSDWKSGTSSAYFSKYDTQWKKSLENCQKMLHFMKEELSNAANEFDNLSGEVKTQILDRMRD